MLEILKWVFRDTWSSFLALAMFAIIVQAIVRAFELATVAIAIVRLEHRAAQAMGEIAAERAAAQPKDQ